MQRLTFKQAAHRLRMSVKLLKWFASYGVRDRKLIVVAGAVEEEELLAFDTYLRQPWPDRDVPAGISAELKREARGRCTICDDPVPLEEAHIRRKGKEVDHYCQHPHNLTLACPTCHTRYDNGDKSLPLDVIETWKETAQQRHLREVDQDIAMNAAIDEQLKPVVEELRRLGPAFWSEPSAARTIGELEAIVTHSTGGVGTPAASPGSPFERLEFLSGSLASDFPVTSAKFESLLDSPGDEADVWRHIDADEKREPWMCIFGDEIALIEDVTCHACDSGVDGYWNEIAASVEREYGQLIAYFEDHEGNLYTPKCPHCGHSRLDFQFQTLCSYHEHQAGKDD